jgi:two-component system, chemotaxis family, protein-glutamate methylesterase/glutaminase
MTRTEATANVRRRTERAEAREARELPRTLDHLTTQASLASDHLTREQMASPVIVVIGASAGGVEAVARVARDLPADLPAAVFIAMHFPAGSHSVLPRILERAGKMSANHPADREPIKAGRIYVAPPDQHLLIGKKTVRLIRGPRENGNRPAVDPMFRSAAVSHGPRVVGVILTGNLDDGTAGLLEIKRRGGVTIVQDPTDALFPSMPTSAMEHGDVDHVLPLKQIPDALADIVVQMSSAEEPARLASEGPMHEDDARREVSYDALDLTTIQDVDNHPGEPSQFGCPDCGGVLWEIKEGDLVRYRCRVGHAWSNDGLLMSQDQQLDGALWTALRALEESASLQSVMAARARKRGNDIMSAKFEREARLADERAAIIRNVLLAGPAARAAAKAAEGSAG